MTFANNNASDRITLRIFHHNHSGSENRARRADRVGHFLPETCRGTGVKTRRTRLRPWLAEIVDRVSGSCVPNQGGARNRRGRFRWSRTPARQRGSVDRFPERSRELSGDIVFFPTVSWCKLHRDQAGWPWPGIFGEPGASERPQRRSKHGHQTSRDNRQLTAGR